MTLFFIIGCSDSVLPENLSDIPGLYDKKDRPPYYELQLSVLPPEYNYLADGSFTWEELNTLDGRSNGRDIEVSGLIKEVQNGVSKPGLLGYGLADANCQVEQRGQSARLFDQKSYEINLVKSGGLFYGHEIINLNKHVEDDTKILNKLSFDLFSLTDELLSLDTNFVHLKVQDLNQENPEFVDYGLYTQVEEVDENYFQKRNLDTRGYLYKAINFEFYRYPESLIHQDNPKYDQKDFEEILAIDGTEDHTYLLEMLDALNNPLIPIDKVMDEYFHRENYLTWLASNILLGNVDSASGNFYLYSQSEDNRWYFIPWDYDKSLTAYPNVFEWQEGVSTYWGSQLHKAFLKSDDNRQALIDKVNFLYENVFNETNINQLIDHYSQVINKFVQPYPDEISSITSKIDENKEKFYESLQKPMPFFIGSVIDQESYLSINWSDSYDFQRQNLTYEIWLSDSPDFSNVIEHEKGLMDTEFIAKPLEPGVYFVKVRVKDQDNHEQASFDFYVDQVTGLYYPGIKAFIVQ